MKFPKSYEAMSSPVALTKENSKGILIVNQNIDKSLVELMISEVKQR